MNGSNTWHKEPNNLQVAERPREQITENTQKAYSPERTMKQTNKPNRRSNKKQRAKPAPNSVTWMMEFMSKNLTKAKVKETEGTPDLPNKQEKLT